MNEDILWVLKVAFAIFCLWYVCGGPLRLSQELDAIRHSQASTSNTASIYQPKVYNQTIIIR